MKALIMREHGDLSVLEHSDVPDAEVVGPRDVRIAVKTAALNHLDLWTVKGLPGLNLTFPHIPGGDGAGVVDAVGSEVSRVQPGDRVLINPGISCYRCEYCRDGEHSLCVEYRLLGEHIRGTLAQYVVVPEVNVFAIPAATGPHPPVSWPEAAAFGLVTLTAWRMVVTQARTQPGEVVLIWGVGGGVSSTAVTIAKLVGATVIATSSSDEKLAVAREMGADITINHREADVAREVRRVTNKRGADVVIENVGEATWEASLRALAKRGRLVTCGATTGPRVVTDVRRLFWNQYTIMGSMMGNAGEFARIVELLGQGQLRPRVDSVFAFDHAIDAFRRMQQGQQLGKLVVEIDAS